MADELIKGLDDLISKTFSADFRKSLEALIMDVYLKSVHAGREYSYNQIVPAMIQNFATALAKFDIEVRTEEIDGEQQIFLDDRGIREVTVVTKHDSKGRIAEFIKTTERG